MSSGYANPYTTAAQAVPNERAAFIRKTYLHLGMAILAFIGVEWFLLQQSWAPALISKMMGMGWLVVLGAFMIVSWIADKMAMSATSKGAQYAGLGLFIVAEAIIFMPLLDYASGFAAGQNAIMKAGVTTAFIFGGLTFAAFVTRKDFSFLRSFLMIGGFVAMGIIVCSVLFPPFGLGTIFAGAMAIFASVSILYNTSNIIHHYRTDQYVSASLSLFASVALLFWYILRIFLSRE